MDKFPEAFRRFEKAVDTEEIRSFQQLQLAFSWWAGRNWRDTPKQIMALRAEARRLGLKVMPEAPRPIIRTWRHETVTVRGTSQSRFRDLKTGRFTNKPIIHLESRETASISSCLTSQSPRKTARSLSELLEFS